MPAQRKIIFRNGQSPGDIVMLLFAIKSIHETYPGQFFTDVRCPARELFEGTGLLTPIEDNEPGVITLQAEYPSIHRSNTHPVRFVTAFAEHMEQQLGLKIRPTRFHSALQITPEEQGWFSAVHEILGRDVPYWIINAGHKSDFTAKAWDFERYQALVERFPDVWFVQVGAAEHTHPELKGANLLNFVGKTDTRQLVRLVWHSFGVISGVSFPMHLAYAVPPHPRFKRASRANITIAGGREPAHWEEGPNHHYIHTCGMLSCCDMGGCWKSRVVALDDNDAKNSSLCVAPVMLPSGQWIGRCMEMISVDDVARVVEKYMSNLEYEPKS